MVIKSVNLETVCGITSTIPDNVYNEVAFAGKSNVGKSSLINALMNRKSLARISSQPGKTQTINFYNVNDAMYLVDLPGYGYANANVEIKAKWGQMIENYLHTSQKLQAVFLLIDIRHDPSENDIMMYDWMVNQGFAPIIIATKSDKLKKTQIDAHIKAIREVLNVEPDTIIIPFSSMSKEGREEIWDLIDSLVFDEETLLAIKQEEEAKRLAKKEAKTNASDKAAGNKKERWKKTGKPVGFIRSCIELGVLVIGFMLGGSVGIGTLITVFCLGACIQLVFKVLRFDVGKIKHKNIRECFVFFNKCING